MNRAMRLMKELGGMTEEKTLMKGADNLAGIENMIVIVNCHGDVSFATMPRLLTLASGENI